MGTEINPREQQLGRAVKGVLGALERENMNRYSPSIQQDLYSIAELLNMQIAANKYKGQDKGFEK